MPLQQAGGPSDGKLKLSQSNSSLYNKCESLAGWMFVTQSRQNG